MPQERPLDAVMRATQIVADWATRTGRALAAIACLFGQIPTADIAAAADSAAAADLPAYAVYRDGVLQGWIVPTIHVAPPRLLVPHPDLLRSAATFVFESTANAEAVAIVERPVYANDWVDRLSMRTQLYLEGQARCRGLQSDLSRYHRLLLLALATGACTKPPNANGSLNTDEILEEFAAINNIKNVYLETILEISDLTEMVSIEDFVNVIESLVDESSIDFLGSIGILSDKGFVDGDQLLLEINRVKDKSQSIHRLLVDYWMDKRNRRWADGIAARPPSAVYVMFVGAAHTITERSLQELLRQRGYEIVSLRLPAITLGTMVRITRSATR